MPGSEDKEKGQDGRVQGRAWSCCRSMKELVLPALMGPGPLAEFGGLVIVFTQTFFKRVSESHAHLR